MRNVSRISAVVLISFACVSSALAASAQRARNGTDRLSARYAAIEKCTQQAHAQAPGGVYGPDQVGKARTLIYMSCMRQMGLAP
jgi:hypothetical protein